jgi:periplasmic divalent cation tolerance protein
VSSIYRWQGAIEEANETVLLLKTTSDLVDRVTRRIVELHSYECPCVVALPIESGHPPYLQWIGDSTSAAELSS